jgi:predicted dehydrogenase
MQCLKAGKHVVMEKPMALTTKECDGLIAAAKQRKLVLSTYHNRHWDAWILKALEVVESGRIGAVRRIETRFGSRGQPGKWWRASRSVSGGILYDWGVHLLEYALQIAKSEVVEVTGFATEGYWEGRGLHPFPKDANEDEARAIVRLRNGIHIDLTVTSLEIESFRGVMRVTGTEGYHVMDWNSYETVVAGEAGVKTVFTGPNPPHEQHKYYENVAAHLAEGVPLVITGEWARRPIHILDLAMESAAKGRSLPARIR